METKDGILYESGAILRYISTLRPELALNGKTAYEAALVEIWMSNIAPVGGAIGACFLRLIGRVPCTPEEHTKNVETVHSKLDTLEEYLAPRTYLVGHSVTLADLCFASLLNILYQFIFSDKERFQYPNLLRYYNNLTASSIHTNILGTNRRFANKGWAVPTVTAEDNKSSAAAPKEVQKPKEPKENKPKQEKPAKQEAPKVEKKEKAPEPEAAAPKEPETTFDLYGFKTLFVNEKDRLNVCQTAFDTYDKEHFSFWHAHYDMHPAEGKELIPTSNLLTNFVSRVNDLGIGKNLIAVHGIFGEEPKLEIKGLWFWKSKDFLEQLKEHPSCEYVKWTKLDPSNEADRNRIIEYWSNIVSGEGVVEGQANKVLKIIK